MPVNDVIFYILDAIIFVMLARMVWNSRKVVIETKTGQKWAVPLLFLIVAVVGVIKYEGVFRIIQTISLVCFAVMFWCMKSGFSDEGIVVMGSLVPYTKAGTISLNKKHSCIIYTVRKREAMMYIDPDQVPEVREFLKKKSKTLR